jgi:nucleotide-binding universal stress UspA family protein
MTKKILFATDFSQASQQSLFFATSLARDNGATLLITHVVETEGAGGTDSLDEDAGPSEAQLNELHAVVPAGATIPCEYKLLCGNPAAKIVEFAEKEDVEAIVVGTHGHSRMGHLLAGSVAQAVMRQAHCAVIAFKPACHVAAADPLLN